MNFADAAEQVLREEGKALPVKDITDRAISGGLISPKSQTPVVFVRAAIRKDNRRRKQQGESERFDLSTTGLVALRKIKSSFR